jgi:antitoxin component HigA of HigAB toxin-antitoxin module
MNKKRPLSLKQIKNLNRQFGIPVQLLIKWKMGF